MPEKFIKTEISHQSKKECEFNMPEGDILLYLKQNQDSNKKIKKTSN